MNVKQLVADLPEPETLQLRSRALAMLEAIICPEWDSRYYSFNQHWSDDQQMASMRNGSGDEFSIVFAPVGVFVRGFSHESTMSPARNDEQLWPGLVDDLPTDFAELATEPAFSYNGHLEATLCLWRRRTDESWSFGDIDFPAQDDADGSGMLRILCDPTPASYVDFATDYYEVDLDRVAVNHVWALLPLTESIVTALNPETSLAEVGTDVAEIGYPRI